MQIFRGWEVLNEEATSNQNFFLGGGWQYFLKQQNPTDSGKRSCNSVKRKRLNYQELVKSCSWSLASHPCVEATVQEYRQQCLFFLFFLVHVSGPIKNNDDWVNRISDKHLYRMRGHWRLEDSYEIIVKSEAQGLPCHQLQDLLRGHVWYQFYIILQMFDMPTDKKKYRIN